MLGAVEIFILLLPVTMTSSSFSSLPERDGSDVAKRIDSLAHRSLREMMDISGNCHALYATSEKGRNAEKITRKTQQFLYDEDLMSLARERDIILELAIRIQNIYYRQIIMIFIFIARRCLSICRGVVHIHSLNDLA